MMSMLKHSSKVLLILPLVFAGCSVSTEDKLASYIADSTCYVQDLVGEVSKVGSGETLSDAQMSELTQKAANMKDELEKKRKTYFATQEEVDKAFNELKDQDQFFAKVKSRIQGKCTADEKTIEDIIERLD